MIDIRKNPLFPFMNSGNFGDEYLACDGRLMDGSNQCVLNFECINLKLFQHKITFLAKNQIERIIELALYNPECSNMDYSFPK